MQRPGRILNHVGLRLEMTRIADLLERGLSAPGASLEDEIVSVDNNDPELSAGDVREIVAGRVLRKSESGERILKQLYRDYAESLIQNLRLEGCSRRTEFGEDQFVRFYPYLPHLIDLSAEIAEGIRRHPDSPRDADRVSRNIVVQCSEMLASERTLLAGQPTGALVSIDKIYEVVEGKLPPQRRKAVADVRGRFNGPRKYRAMAERVARAICLMEFVETDLPRSNGNLAALMIQHVSEAPATPAVAEILHHLRESHFVRETENGWTLHDFDELRRAAAAVASLRDDVGTVNPRLPGWRNDLIQVSKRLLARALAWYTRPLNEFNTAVSRLLDDVVRSLGYLSANMTDPERVAANTDDLDRLSADMVALESRLTRLDKRNAATERSTADASDIHTPEESVQEQLEFLREKLDYVQEQVRALVSVMETTDAEASGDGVEKGPGRGGPGSVPGSTAVWAPETTERPILSGCSAPDAGMSTNYYCSTLERGRVSSETRSGFIPAPHP